MMPIRKPICVGKSFGTIALDPVEVDIAGPEVDWVHLQPAACGRRQVADAEAVMARRWVVAAALEEVVGGISAGAERRPTGGEEGDGAVGVINVALAHRPRGAH